MTPGGRGGPGGARSTRSSRCRPTCPARERCTSRRSRTRRHADRLGGRSRSGSRSILADADVDPGRTGGAQQVPAVESLDPQTEADQARFLFANIGAVLILVGIFSFGFTVLTGVIEEKQSRVVEVVLSTVRPRDLLMGKVLGIGILGVVQLLVFVVAALGAASLTERFALPATTPCAIGLLVDLVRPRLRALLDRARLPRCARVAARGGIERVDAGDDDRDDQLLRGDLRGHQRPVRDRGAASRRSSRHRRRSSCPCEPRSTRSSRSRWSSPSP